MDAVSPVAGPVSAVQVELSLSAVAKRPGLGPSLDDVEAETEAWVNVDSTVEGKLEFAVLALVADGPAEVRSHAYNGCIEKLVDAPAPAVGVGNGGRTLQDDRLHL